MKNLITICSLFLPLTIFSQWFTVSSPVSSDINTIGFVNSTTGYLSGVSTGNVFKTTNAGLSWAPNSTGSSIVVYDCKFLDMQTGFVCGTSKSIYKTTNSGTTWVLKSSGTGTVYSISFGSSSTGYAVCGTSSTVLKTTDIGETWTALAAPSSNNLKGISFVDNLTGWICGSNGTLWKTTDGCISWISQNQSSTFGLEKVVFTTGSIGYISGSNGAVFKTTNAGNAWTLLNTGTSSYLYCIYYAPPQGLFATGQNGTIIYSSNSGSNWIQQTAVTSSNIYSISMIDQNTGFAAGAGGVLLKTTNGGGVPLTPIFTKITSGPIVSDFSTSSMLAWGDFNDDNLQDLFVLPWDDACWNCAYPILQYRNDGGGSFFRMTNSLLAPLYSGNGIAWGDYDNDGRLDLYISRYFNQTNLLYHNNGFGAFSNVTTGPEVTDIASSCACAWCDYDKDGWLDLFVAHGQGQKNALYHNEGNGTFTKVTAGAIANDIGESRGCAWGDYDNDGWPDLYVCNYGSTAVNFLYHNNGNGTFTRITNSPLVTGAGYGESAVWFDYDNDGWLDILVTYNAANNRLFHNDHNGNFTLTTLAPSQEFGWSYYPSVADINNDGWLDIFVPKRTQNGYTGINCLYENIGGTAFIKLSNDIVDQEGGTSDAGAFADYDNDGKVDLAVTQGSGGGTTHNLLYHNTNPNPGNYITIKLQGCVANKSAIGTRVRVVTGSFRQMREVSGGNGSESMLWQHFGLGNVTNIDSIVVTWTTGNQKILTNVSVNQLLTITECPVGVKNNEIPVKFELEQNYPNPFNPSTLIKYSVPKKEFVRLYVIDLLGRTVKELVNNERNPGTYEVRFDGSSISSGIYFFKIEAGEYSDLKKMVLLK